MSCQGGTGLRIPELWERKLVPGCPCYNQTSSESQDVGTSACLTHTTHTPD